MPALEDLQVLLAADYSGIEVRMLAIASKDKLLVEQFNQNRDIHSLVGVELTGWLYDKIRHDKETRRAVKEFHFGVIYGLGLENGPPHLQSKGVKITKTQFAQFQRRYFERYSGVKKFIDKCHYNAEHRNMVETIFGFRRRLSATDERRSTYYLNQAVNSPIQGAAHQLVLIALALLRLESKRYNLLFRPIMEVHDELVFRVRFGDLLEADNQLRHLFEIGVVEYILDHFKMELPIPLKAETKSGFTRGTMIGYEDKENDLPLPIPSLEKFLIDWRVKYQEIASTPLEKLIPKELEFV